VQKITEQGLKNDLDKLATSILDDPPDVATFLAHVMTGSGIGLNKPPADSRIVRMSPLISPVKTQQGWGASDSASEDDFAPLVKLDMDAVEQRDVGLIVRHADRWTENTVRNQPVRMNGDTLELEIGQADFKTALAAWQAIS